MIQLVTRGTASGISSTLVGVFKRHQFESEKAFIQLPAESSFGVCEVSLNEYLTQTDAARVSKVQSLSHLTDGDIVSVNPLGWIHTLFRVNSKDNTLFITDRCNSNCLMCSQPPKKVDDLTHFYELNTQLIRLIPKETEVIGITGGEPTLLGSRLFTLLRLLDAELPNTSVHMLSNGRSFAWKDFAEEISDVNENLVIGIPLYADNPHDHDYVVQAKDAFVQTITGLHNLARYNVRIEVRIVLHKLTYWRLPKTVQFIYKNFPFVEHIALMGLEYVGYTPFNHDKLWIEPSEYKQQLAEACSFLKQVGMRFSIYNLQHCLLPEDLWEYSRHSISDWKREYVEECKKCSKIDACCGVFATSKLLSSEIKAFADKPIVAINDAT